MSNWDQDDNPLNGEGEALKPLEPMSDSDYDEYDQDVTRSRTRFKLAPKGVYPVKSSRELDWDDGFRGYLTFHLGPMAIVGGEFDGQEIRFVDISVERSMYGPGNRVLDYLRANGSWARPRTNEDYIDLVREVFDRHVAVTAGLNWRAQCPVCKFTLKEMAKFPRNEEGQPLTRFECPDCKAAGRPASLLWANLRLTHFVVQKEEEK